MNAAHCLEAELTDELNVSLRCDLVRPVSCQIDRCLTVATPSLRVRITRPTRSARAGLQSVLEVGVGGDEDLAAEISRLDQQRPAVQRSAQRVAAVGDVDRPAAFAAAVEAANDANFNSLLALKFGCRIPGYCTPNSPVLALFCDGGIQCMPGDDLMQIAQRNLPPAVFNFWQHANVKRPN